HVAGVEEQHQVDVGVGRWPLDNLVETGHPGVLVGEWRRDHDVDGLAARAQRLREGEAAAQRVAVGVFVTEDQDLLVAVEQLLELTDSHKLRDGHSWPSLPGCSSAGSGRISRRRFEMCTEYSID